MASAAIFLDRDGVLNKAIVVNGKPFAPLNLSEFQLIEGVKESLTRLREAGFVNIVITNQPDLSTGKQTQKELDRTHTWLMDTLDLDAIFVCPHLRDHKCDCRKPRIGLLEKARLQFGIKYEESFLVGDRWSDIEAGQAAGVRRNFFIDYSYNEQKPSGIFEVVRSLHEATKKIIKFSGGS